MTLNIVSLSESSIFIPVCVVVVRVLWWVLFSMRVKPFRVALQPKPLPMQTSVILEKVVGLQ